MLTGELRDQVNAIWGVARIWILTLLAAGELGEADAALMNTVCFDAFALGNREFDKGDTGLKQWLDLLNSGVCQTPMLSANAQFGANSALHASRAPGMVVPYTIVERDGQQIGIVG